MRRPFGLLMLAAAALASSCAFEARGHRAVALLYGVSEYNLSGTTGNLQWPTADVESLAPLLDASSGGLYDTVIARTDADATHAHILADIAAQAAALGPDDQLLFYYSGHGDQGQLSGLDTPDAHAYIIPVDAYDGDAVYPENLITEDDLRAALAAVPTKHIVIILDCCFSGGFIRGGDPNIPQDGQAYYDALWASLSAGEDPSPSLKDWWDTITSDHSAALGSWHRSLAAGSGFAGNEAQVFTAAGALEESYDDDNHDHGAFTYWLLQAARHGDADHNGLVTVNEAYRYTFERLQTEWNRVWGVVAWASIYYNSQVFLPQLSDSPVDHGLFKAR